MYSKFQIGEETAQKASPAQVSQLMMTAKDASGNHIFSSSEFLTVQQITSFFSRLASKRSLAGHLDIQVATDDEDGEAEVNEAAFQELSDYVMANILPTHLICYDSFNLCHLMSKSKLSTLAVKLLKEISRTKRADLFIVCCRSATDVQADLQTNCRSSAECL